VQAQKTLFPLERHPLGLAAKRLYTLVAVPKGTGQVAASQKRAPRTPRLDKPFLDKSESTYQAKILGISFSLVRLFFGPVTLRFGFPLH
jgi:hypothetical protein